MIKKNNKTIEGVFKGTTEIGSIYKGTLLVYESWKTLPATGVPPLTLANCKNTNLLDYKIYGNSVQVKNLYTNNFKNLNNQITVGENGWLKLNITTSGFKNFNSNPSIEILPNTIYTVIVETSADYSDSGTTYLSINSTPTGSSDIPQFTTTWTNTLSANQKYKILLASSENPQETGKVLLRSYFGNSAGNTVTGAIRISLIKGNIDVNNFVYEDYTLSPTPDNPAEIESVGEKSKNLIDISNFTTQTVTGVTYTNNGDGTITINGTATGWGQTSLASIGYTISGINGVASFVALSGSYTTTSSSYPRAGLIAPSNSSVNYPVLNSSNSYTFTSDKSINRFVFQHTIGNVFNNLVVGLQVEEGSTATDFIPYNKYKIPITVSGKNKFNINETQITNPKGNYYTPIVTVDGSTLKMKARNANAIQPAYFHCDVGEGNRVTLRVSGILGEGTNPSNTRVRYSFTNDVNYIANGELVGSHLSYIPFSSTEVKTFSVTTNATARYMLVCIGIQQKAGGELAKATADFTNIQVEYGNTTTDYENYITPNTTNIYLDAPLRKIGDFADYIDYKNSKVVRQLSYKVFTGNEVWNYESLSGNRNNFYTSITDATGNRNNKIYSNMFEFYAGGAMDKAYSCMISNAKNLNIRYQDYNNTTDLKAKLSEMYSANKPLYIIYPLGNEIEESITLPNILLNKGSNVIDVDTTIKPSNMYVEYKGKVG